MLVLDPKYAYLVSHLPYAVMWAVLYIAAPQVRRMLIVMSSVCAFGALSSPLFVPSYWFPDSAFPMIRLGLLRLFVEDVLNASLFTGIVSVLYPALRSKTLIPDPALPGGARFSCLIVAVLTLGSIKFGVHVFPATGLSFLAATAFMLLKRPDLCRISLESGYYAALAMLVCYVVMYFFISNSEEIVRRWWHYTWTDALGKWGVLAVELIWSFAFGTFFGPLYAFSRRMRYI